MIPYIYIYIYICGNIMYNHIFTQKIKYIIYIKYYVVIIIIIIKVRAYKPWFWQVNIIKNKEVSSVRNFFCQIHKLINVLT